MVRRIHHRLYQTAGGWIPVDHGGIPSGARKLQRRTDRPFPIQYEVEDNAADDRGRNPCEVKAP